MNMSHEKTTDTSGLITEIDLNKGKALLCAKAALDKKAEHVKVLEISELSAFTDYFVICSGTSDRHVQSIADSITSELKKASYSIVSIEGYGDGRWVLIDAGDVVIHVFLDALRDYYNLENLWSEAPRVKIPSEYYGPSASQLN